MVSRPQNINVGMTGFVHLNWSTKTKYQQLGPRSGPTFWIQTIWHFESVPERYFFSKKSISKKLAGLKTLMWAWRDGLDIYSSKLKDIFVTLTTNSYQEAITWWLNPIINTEFLRLYWKPYTSFNKQCRYWWEVANKKSYVIKSCPVW